MDVGTLADLAVAIFISKEIPRPMHEALLAIEQIALPENFPILQATAAQYQIRVDPDRRPEYYALQLWLKDPYTCAELQAFKASLRQLVSAPANDLNQTSPRGNNHDPDPQLLAAIAALPRNRIFRRPPEVLDSISQMLYQRFSYPEILARLGQYGQLLNPNNLSRYKKSPRHQAWLKDQQRREAMRAQLQVLLDLSGHASSAKIHEAVEHTAAMRLCQVLADCDASALKSLLEHDPKALVRLIQYVPKFSQGGMDCERLRLEIARANVELEKAKLPPEKRGLTRQTLEHIEHELHLT